MVQAKVTYNRYGWHDPEGRFFVLKEELERHGGLASYIRKVETGKIQVEPLVIRANAGDCIELHTTNLLPEYLGGNAFQLRTRTDIAGHHVHLVKFDTIVADGAACPGDYLYRSGSFKWDVESGMWGIFRVMKRTFAFKCKGICNKIFGCFR